MSDKRIVDPLHCTDTNRGESPSDLCTKTWPVPDCSYGGNSLSKQSGRSYLYHCLPLPPSLLPSLFPFPPPTPSLHPYLKPSFPFSPPSYPLPSDPRQSWAPGNDGGHLGPTTTKVCPRDTQEQVLLAWSARLGPGESWWEVRQGTLQETEGRSDSENSCIWA